MALESRQSSECLPAILAFEGLVSCLHSKMNYQVATTVEMLATLDQRTEESFRVASAL